MTSLESLLLVGRGSVTGPAGHQQSCIMLGPVRTMISTRNIWGRAFRLDAISLCLSLSNLETQILQPRASLFWRACLIIVSDIWKREAVQKRGPDSQELTDGMTRPGIRGLESRTQSARFDG
jgi:hypothetical protein